MLQGIAQLLAAMPELNWRVQHNMMGAWGPGLLSSRSCWSQ